MNITSFRGIHNTLERHDLGAGDLSDALNIDVGGRGGDNEQRILRVRPGYTKAFDAPLSSSYSTRGGTPYVVSGGQLNKVVTGPSLRAVCPCATDLFCDFDEVLFTGDWKMLIGESVSDFEVPYPGTQPQVTITGGDREPGLYTCGYTLSNADGFQSGLSPVSQVKLDEPGEILVTPPVYPGYAITVYVAPADGSVFFDESGTPLAPQNVGTFGLPSDDVVAIEVMDAKLFVASRYSDYSVIRFSKPYHYHLFDYSNDYIVLPDDVRFIKAVGSTLLIGGAYGIYAYSDGGLVRVADYGVVNGRSIVIGPDGKGYLHTSRGVCSAMPFTPLTEDRVSLPMGSICSAALMHHNGIFKYIGLHDNSGLAFNAAF